MSGVSTPRIVAGASPVTQPPPDARTGEGLAGYLNALWRARWIILAGSLLAGLNSWIVSSSLSRKYEATATLMVSPPKVGEASSGSVLGLEVRNYRSYLENQSLSAELVREFKLDGPPHRLTPESFLDSALTVADVRDSRLLEVRVKLNEPKLAADVANALALRAVELSRTLNQEEVVAARDIIKQQLDVARERLTAARAAYERGQRAAQIELLEQDVGTLLEQQKDLRLVHVRIERERAKLSQAEAELARQQRVRDVRRAVGTLEPPEEPSVPSRPEPSVPSRPEPSPPPPKQTAPGTPLTSASPPPATSSREENEEETRLPIRDDMLDPYVNPVYEYLNQQVVASRTSLAALESQRDALLRTLRSKGGEFPVLADLYKRKAEVDEFKMQQELAEKIYLDVATRHEAARLQVAERSAQLQLVDRALAPERPVSPRPLRNALAAMVLAPSALTLIVVLIEALRRVMALRST